MAEGVVAQSAPRRVGWYYGWNIVGLSVICQMMSVGLVMNSFSLFVLGWSHDFHAPVSTFQLALTVFAVVSIPFCAVSGWMADRLSIRWMLPIGLLIVAASEVAIGLSQASWLVVWLYAVVSIGVVISSAIPCQAMVARWFVKSRGLALGISANGMALSVIIFPPIAGALMHAFGWRETWWIFAGFTAVVVVPLLILAVRDRPGPNNASTYLTGTAAQQEAAKEPALTYLQIVLRPNFWLIGLPFVIVFAAYYGVISNLAPMAKVHGIDAPTAAVLLSAYGIADLIGKLGCGAAADRFGARSPIAVLCIIGAVGAAGLAFAPDLGLVIAALLAVGLIGGIWSLAAAATAIEFGQQNFGRAYGLMSAFSAAGAFMPWVLARAQEWTGSYVPGFVGLGALLLVGLVLTLVMREKKLDGRDSGPRAAAAVEAA